MYKYYKQGLAQSLNGQNVGSPGRKGEVGGGDKSNHKNMDIFTFATHVDGVTVCITYDTMYTLSYREI